MFTLSNKFLAQALLIVVFIFSNTALSAPGTPNSPVNASSNPKINEAMKAMKGWTKILGKPRVEGETLRFGITNVNIDFTIVDGLKSHFGITATFFVKKDNDFVRVSTNIMKNNNERAVGTILDPNGPAIAAIREGKPYYGVVDILGKKYDTGYEPIFNEKNEVIGIYYVGQAIK